MKPRFFIEFLKIIGEHNKNNNIFLLINSEQKDIKNIISPHITHIKGGNKKTWCENNYFVPIPMN